MPIYEYKCSYCGNVSELLEKLNTNIYHDCCVCGKKLAMEKQYSVPSISNNNSNNQYNYKKNNIDDTQSVPCHGKNCNCPFANR